MSRWSWVRTCSSEREDDLIQRDDSRSRERAVEAARAAADKQATDTVVLEVGEVLSIVDWFVITSAPNPRLVRTIAEEVEARLKAGGSPGPLRTEGLDDARWGRSEEHTS